MAAGPAVGTWERRWRKGEGHKEGYSSPIRADRTWESLFLRNGGEE